MHLLREEKNKVSICSPTFIFKCELELYLIYMIAVIMSVKKLSSHSQSLMHL